MVLKNEAGSAISALVDAAHSLPDGPIQDRILDTAHRLRGMTLHGSMPDGGIIADTARLLKDQGIKATIIGGIAVSVHGQTRATEDIDFLVDKLPPNRTLADVEYMQQFGFYKARSRTGTTVTLDHRKGSGGQVDFLVASSAIDKLALKTASNQNVLSHRFKVVSPSGLVALKLQAIEDNPARKKKDRADLVSVFDHNDLDLSEYMPHLSDESKRLLAALS